MYMTALSYLSRWTGHPGPLEDPLTCCMVLGLGCQTGILRDRHSPITIEVLRSLSGALESVCLSHYEYLLFHALFTVAFFGALRIEEMVAKYWNVLQPELLFLCDLQLTERVAVFYLSSSHECQERPVISLGLSGECWVCLAQLALHSYVRVQLRREGPLFMHSIRTCVTRRELVAVLQDALRRLGLRAEYYGVHSWLGTVVTALHCGYFHEQASCLARWPCALPCRPRPGGASCSHPVVQNLYGILQ